MQVVCFLSAEYRVSIGICAHRPEFRQDNRLLSHELHEEFSFMFASIKDHMDPNPGSTSGSITVYNLHDITNPVSRSLSAEN